jgi:hypothetical protein
MIIFRQYVVQAVFILLYSTQAAAKVGDKPLVPSLIIHSLSPAFINFKGSQLRHSKKGVTKSETKKNTSALMMSNKKNKEIYDIKGSGWKSPYWNWGSANGTGHDCALLCRRKFNTKEVRGQLIKSLMAGREKEDQGSNDTPCDNLPFEEVKLILGLTIQRGRWDGTDGGSPGGYSEVLEFMAQAKRYESDNEDMNAKLFVQDMSERFQLIAHNDFDDGASSIDGEKSMKLMTQIIKNDVDDADAIRRKCTGLVLLNMGFIEFGM